MTSNTKMTLQTAGGPPTIPILEIALLVTSQNSSEYLRTFLSVMEKYGPIITIWLGPQLLVAISDPKDIERLITHDKFCKRGPYFRNIMRRIFSTGLLPIDKETWRKHSKIVTTAFQNNILDKFVNSFSKYSCILSDRLNDIHDGEFHNIFMLFSQCTFVVICDTVFGYKLNSQANDDTEIADSIQSIVDHTVQHTY
jgi:cytochrome P450 family 4